MVNYMKDRLDMKKLSLTLFSFLALSDTLYADSSDRFIVFYLGAGVNGSLSSSHVTELANPSYKQNNNSLNIQSSSNTINSMCKSGTCDLSSLGVGIGGEAGIKLRPFSFLEFDFWIGYDRSYMATGSYPNFIKLKDGDYNYLNTYTPGKNGESGKFADVSSWLEQISANATVTFRIKRLGFIGGVGASGWFQTYQVTLKNQYGDEKNSEESIGGGRLNLILGLSYRIGQNKGNGEVVLRFVMPCSAITDEKGYSYNGTAYGDNGYIKYHERVTMHPYMINLMSRWYF